MTSPVDMIKKTRSLSCYRPGSDVTLPIYGRGVDGDDDIVCIELKLGS